MTVSRELQMFTDVGKPPIIIRIDTQSFSDKVSINILNEKEEPYKLVISKDAAKKLSELLERANMDK